MNKLGMAIMLAAMLLAGEADAGSFRVWGEDVILCDSWILDRHSDLIMASHESLAPLLRLVSLMVRI